jgi:hypothetical protein
MNSPAEFTSGGNVYGIGGNNDPIHPAMKHESPHIDFPLKASSLADDQGALPQHFSFQTAIEADFPVAEFHGTDHDYALADQAQGRVLMPPELPHSLPFRLPFRSGHLLPHP